MWLVDTTASIDPNFLVLRIGASLFATPALATGRANCRLKKAKNAAALRVYSVEGIRQLMTTINHVGLHFEQNLQISGVHRLGAPKVAVLLSGKLIPFGGSIGALTVGHTSRTKNEL